MALFTGCLLTVKTVIWRYCSNRLNIRKTTSFTKVPVRAQGKGSNCYFLPIWIWITLFWASFLFFWQHTFVVYMSLLCLWMFQLLAFCCRCVFSRSDYCRMVVTAWNGVLAERIIEARHLLHCRRNYSSNIYQLLNCRTKREGTYIISSSSVFQVKQLAWILTRKI